MSQVHMVNKLLQFDQGKRRGHKQNRWTYTCMTPCHFLSTSEAIDALHQLKQIILHICPCNFSSFSFCTGKETNLWLTFQTQSAAMFSPMLNLYKEEKKQRPSVRNLRCMNTLTLLLSWCSWDLRTKVICPPLQKPQIQFVPPKVRNCYERLLPCGVTGWRGIGLCKPLHCEAARHCHSSLHFQGCSPLLRQRDPYTAAENAELASHITHSSHFSFSFYWSVRLILAESFTAPSETQPFYFEAKA